MKKDVVIYNQKLARKAQNNGVFKLCDLNSFMAVPILQLHCFGRNENCSRSINMAHSSLLRTFGYFAISTYNS